MNKKYNSLMFLIPIIIFSCGIKNYKLKNGKTKVPLKKEEYKNRLKFDKKLTKLIDTNILYERFDDRYNTVRRQDTHNETRIYGVYRFYSNGNMNLFFIDRNQLENEENYDPEINGKRGNYYIENNIIKYDLYAEIDELGKLGRMTGSIKINGDTIYIRKQNAQYTYKYIKRKVNITLIDFSANW